MKMNLKYLLIAIGILMVAEPALALRCGSKLVNTGDHKSKILKHCGEPTSVQVRTVVRGYAGSHAKNRHRHSVGRHDNEHPYPSYNEIIVEEWTYNFGPRRLMRTITFENGLVVAVKQLRSGYRE